jgi:hypothetical protein
MQLVVQRVGERGDAGVEFGGQCIPAGPQYCPILVEQVGLLAFVERGGQGGH